jgi:hypothetical protein
LLWQEFRIEFGK